MRDDIAGLFWDDTPAAKVPKAPPPKREPPARTWEAESYLPYYEEACRFPVQLMTPDDLQQAAANREPLLFDCEVYPNYYLAAFASFVTGKVYFFEMEREAGEFHNGSLDVLRWITCNFTLVTFNGNYFDVPILALALAGAPCEVLHEATKKIITENVKPWQVLRGYKVEALKLDHIDLIEVCPLAASLKMYGGRLHVPKMQELPYSPTTPLSDARKRVVRWYCIGSDLVATGFVRAELEEQLELRRQMGLMYGVDLRSKSDAQIAEAVIVHELMRFNYGVKPQRPELPEGTVCRYTVPAFLRYETSDLQYVLQTVANAVFPLDGNGSPQLPPEVKALRIPMAGNFFQMGIGGLHSTEECMALKADAEFALLDRDVASYYPNIILNLGLYPKHLGTAFLEVYRSLVERRLSAKKEKRMVEANTLKIVINGSFGKLGSKWSTLYSPDLMLQVTLTGQLSLLMLIERLTLAGVPVRSANTDGILIHCRHADRPKAEAIVASWERDTGFTTEETEYKAIFARDVNNYVAIKTKGDAKARFLDQRLGCKVKGAFCERGSAGDSVLSKNPQAQICNDAALVYLTNGTHWSETVRQCRDLRRFLIVRHVSGGAYWPKGDEYLGKACRWYWATNLADQIVVYATGEKGGDKVPQSDGARPVMQLPDEFPQDVDFVRYEQVTEEILREIGAISGLPEINA